jgi:ribosomal protein L44E
MAVGLPDPSTLREIVRRERREAERAAERAEARAAWELLRENKSLVDDLIVAGHVPEPKVKYRRTGLSVDRKMVVRLECSGCGESRTRDLKRGGRSGLPARLRVVVYPSLLDRLPRWNRLRADVPCNRSLSRVQ